MKSKLSTPVLIVLVIAVWGLVFFRLFNSWTDDGYERSVSQNFVKETYNDYSFEDTTRLNLNYRDPFRISARPFKAVMSVPAGTKPGRPVQSSPSWAVITYSGYIKNPAGKTLALVNVNGKNTLLAEGQKVDNIKLVKNFKDSIKVSSEGRIKFISIAASD